MAGVRIDSAALLVKDPQLAEEPPETETGRAPVHGPRQLHEIYRRWRSIADGYAEPRVLVGEIWLPDAERLARYLRPDELHTAFNFDFLACPWEPRPMRASIEPALAAHAPVDAPTTWVLSNHDVTRPVTRYGRADTAFAFESKRAGTPTDLELGTRRARAAALLAMALPGSMYVYQGEELGLPEVEDIPSDRRQDPMWLRSGGVDPGRDGCRIPLPWAGDRPPYGFSGPSDRPWLDPPEGWARLTVEAQSENAASMLTLYRAGLALRRSAPWCPTARSPGFPPTTPSRLRARRRLRVPRQLRRGSGRTSGRRRASYSRAMSSKEVRCLRTRPSGSARTSRNDRFLPSKKRSRKGRR